MGGTLDPPEGSYADNRAFNFLSVAGQTNFR